MANKKFIRNKRLKINLSRIFFQKDILIKKNLIKNRLSPLFKKYHKKK